MNEQEKNQFIELVEELESYQKEQEKLYKERTKDLLLRIEKLEKENEQLKQELKK